MSRLRGLIVSGQCDLLFDMTDTNSETNDGTNDGAELLNELESQLARGRSEESGPVDVILALLNNEVFVLSRDEVKDESGSVEPLLLTNKEGGPMLAVFSHPSRVPEAYAETAPYALGLHGSTVIHSLGEDTGMVINPGHELGFEIDPEGVANIQRDFRPANEAAAPGAAEAVTDAPDGGTSAL